MSGMDIITKVAWVPVRDGKILCARTRGLKLFYNAGGKPLPGEADWEALCREVLEEVGVVLNPTTISLICEVSGPGVDKAAGKTVVLRAFAADGLGEPRPCGEVEEIRWLDITDSHLLPPLGQRVFREALFFACLCARAGGK